MIISDKENSKYSIAVSVRVISFTVEVRDKWSQRAVTSTWIHGWNSYRYGRKMPKTERIWLKRDLYMIYNDNLAELLLSDKTAFQEIANEIINEHLIELSKIKKE